MLPLLFLLYTALGVSGMVFFRQGGVYTDYYWHFFLLGSICGWTSTWVVMLIYARSSSVNVATMITTVLSSVAGQTILWLCFNSPINWQMLLGMGILLAGMLTAVSEPVKPKEDKNA